MLARDGIPAGRDLPVPDDVRALVAKRIRALPTATREALLRTAIAAHPSVDLVDASALGPAEEIDLVRVADDGRIHFTHPLYASAVHASTPLVRRRRAHSDLAGSVSSPEERARHLALATAEPDEQIAETVVAAARLARGRGAPDTAAELSELAVRLSAPESPSLGQRKLELAQHLHLAGDLDRAARLLEDLAASLPSGDLKLGSCCSCPGSSTNARVRVRRLRLHAKRLTLQMLPCCRRTATRCSPVGQEHMSLREL
jgi:hypothetical protein